MDLLIEQMEKKVKKIMKAYHEDFYRYDVERIRQLRKEGIKDFVWMVYDCGTHLVDHYQEKEQQEYLKAIKNVKGDYLKNGRGILFLCNLQTNRMKKITFDDIIAC